MRAIVLTGFGVILFLPAAVALSADESPIDSRVAQRMEIQQGRRAEIEERAAREREATEQWYERRRRETVEEITRKAAARIDYPFRMRWVEFMKMHRGRSHPEAYFDASNYGFVLLPEAEFACLRQAMNQEYFVTEMAALLAGEAFERKLSQIVRERLDAPLLPLLRDQAAEMLDYVCRVRGRLRMALNQLERQRQAKLAATTVWKEGLESDVRNTLGYLGRRASRPARFGVVGAVGYSPDGGYFCTIEGVPTVLERGDRVDGVRVVGVGPKKVQFAKGDRSWEQELGAPSSPFWQ